MGCFGLCALIGGIVGGIWCCPYFVVAQWGLVHVGLFGWEAWVVSGFHPLRVGPSNTEGPPLVVRVWEV